MYAMSESKLIINKCLSEMNIASDVQNRPLQSFGIFCNRENAMRVFRNFSFPYPPVLEFSHLAFPRTKNESAGSAYLISSICTSSLSWIPQTHSADDGNRKVARTLCTLVSPSRPARSVHYLYCVLPAHIAAGVAR